MDNPGVSHAASHRPAFCLDGCLLAAAYWEGDTRAQSVWQASCTLVQLLKQEALASALPVVRAVDVPDNALPGTMHVVWQLAACELHVIMQLVVIELCAR